MYKVLKNKTTGEFEVVEVASELIVDSFSSHEEAQLQYQKLKKGVGFEGWTPSFMLTKGL